MNIRSIETYDKPTIFFASNKHFLQSNIYFYLLGNTLESVESRMACEGYNEYMGGSMAGVVFQEIRELRSLGYSAYAYYSYDRLNRRPGHIFGFLGTQADKTVEGCQRAEVRSLRLRHRRSGPARLQDRYHRA